MKSSNVIISVKDEYPLYWGWGTLSAYLSVRKQLVGCDRCLISERIFHSKNKGTYSPAIRVRHIDNGPPRQIDWTQGAMAMLVVLRPSFPWTGLFLDGVGRLYVEKHDVSRNDSFVYDLQEAMIASYTAGHSLIDKASKYQYYLMDNREDPRKFHWYS